MTGWEIITDRGVYHRGYLKNIWCDKSPPDKGPPDISPPGQVSPLDICPAWTIVPLDICPRGHVSPSYVCPPQKCYHWINYQISIKFLSLQT